MKNIEMSKEITISQEQIENRIFTIGGVQLMVDYHLAEKRMGSSVSIFGKRIFENLEYAIWKQEIL